MRIIYLRAMLIALPLFAAATMHPALAQPQAQGATIEFGLGAEHTDNAYKLEPANAVCAPTVTDPHPVCIRSEAKEYLNLDLGYLRTGEVFEVEVLYNGEFANYEHETTDADTVLQGHSSATWNILPGRLAWDFSHDRSEQLQDSRNPDIRGNRQLRDIFTAGPTFTARLSPVDNLILAGTYYDISYDDSNRLELQQSSDSERLQGAIGWQHYLSKTDVLSLNYQYMDTNFSGAQEDVQYQRLYGTYEVALASSGYTISIGLNQAQRESGSDSDGFYAQIGGHLETGGQRFRINVVNELTDSGIGLGANSQVNDDFRPDDGNFGVIDTVERSTLEFSYGYDRLCERCTLDLRVSADNQDFDVQPRDQELRGYGGSFRYRLTSTISVAFNAGWSETEYTEEGRSDEGIIYRMDLDWRLSRSLRVAFWLVSDERDSDQLGQDFEEYYGGASVHYKFR